MPRTHQFTQNSTGQKIDIVIDKIKSFERDNFSDCTRINTIDGMHYGVSESLEEVRRIVNESP